MMKLIGTFSPASSALLNVGTDGSQDIDFIAMHKHVVAGSSPASGTKCRSSSVVEHVKMLQFVSYPSVKIKTFNQNQYET